MAAEKKQEPVFNATGTHVFVTTPSGDLWECPPDYLPVALLRGFEVAPAPVDDGVREEDAPPPKKKSESKTSGD